MTFFASHDNRYSHHENISDKKISYRYMKTHVAAQMGREPKANEAALKATRE
jgi:hypothetical protein